MTKRSASGHKPALTGKQRRISEHSLANLRPFKKNDPRINRKGRPKTHDELRDLIHSVAAEKLQGVALTRIEAKIRQLFASQKPVDTITLIEHGWGKVTQPIAVTLESELADILRAHPEFAAEARELLGAERAAQLFAQVGLPVAVGDDPA